MSNLIRDAILFHRIRQQWLGEGMPVAQDVAQARADTCLACPKHEVLAREAVTAPIANMTRRQMEVKAALKLHVERESELHSCGLCGCYMPLKVWLPIELARENTPDWPTFPANCWMHNA